MLCKTKRSEQLKMREDELKKQKTIRERLDSIKRQKYYCNKCKSYHFYDSKKGIEHKLQKRKLEDVFKSKIEEFKEKFTGAKVEMQMRGSYRIVTLTGKMKRNYVEVEGKGWVHRSLIFFPGKAYKQPKRYELKEGEKGFWEI